MNVKYFWGKMTNSNLERTLTSWIHFRNSHSLGPVIVQSFMLLCSFLIILGLIYVVLLVLAIAIHHLIYDRDPKKVPDFVKNSIQFSSSESEDEQNDHGDSDNESPDDAERTSTKGAKYANTARKLANLDKFLSHDTKSQYRTIAPGGGGGGGGDKDTM